MFQEIWTLCSGKASLNVSFTYTFRTDTLAWSCANSWHLRTKSFIDITMSEIAMMVVAKLSILSGWIYMAKVIAQVDYHQRVQFISDILQKHTITLFVHTLHANKHEQLNIRQGQNRALHQTFLQCSHRCVPTIFSSRPTFNASFLMCDAQWNMTERMRT